MQLRFDRFEQPGHLRACSRSSTRALSQRSSCGERAVCTEEAPTGAPKLQTFGEPDRPGQNRGENKAEHHRFHDDVCRHEASEEMVRPTVYGQIVIFLVFVPCLSFQGVEGKLFSPMVITLMLALASAFLLSLTFVPAMAAILVRGKVAEREVSSIRVAKHLYAPA